MNVCILSIFCKHYISDGPVVIVIGCHVIQSDMNHGCDGTVM